MEKLNLPPFTPGQKVVCIETGESWHGDKTLKGEIYTVRRCEFDTNRFVNSPNEPGVWVLWIDENTAGWWCEMFRPIQESKFKAVTFEKICEEVELICEN